MLILLDWMVKQAKAEDLKRTGEVDGKRTKKNQGCWVLSESYR
jgi:hypothetical protein